MRRRRSQPLVDETDRNGGDTVGQQLGVVAYPLCGQALLTGEGHGQTDHHRYRPPFYYELGQLREIAVV